MPEVSVIMSVYNADNYNILVNSVNSILNQSFKDFEFIICDDGSSNKETRKFLKMINDLDPRILEKVIKLQKMLCNTLIISLTVNV